MPGSSAAVASWRAALLPATACVVLSAVAAAFIPQFATVHNMLGLAQALAAPAMVAVALAPCIAGGDIDLSVEAVLALGGGVGAVIVTSSGSVPIGLLAGLAAGGLVGAANGVLVVRLGLPSLPATLASMWVVRAACLWMAGGIALQAPDYGGTLPADTAWLSIPAPIWAAACVVVAYGMLGGRTTKSADRIGARRFARLCLLGVVAGFAGAVMVGAGSPAQPLGWQGVSVDVLAACLLGGAVLGRCVGPIVGLLLGTALVGVTRNAMDLLCLTSASQYAVRGLLLVVALVWAARRRGRPFAAGETGEEVVT